MKAKSVFTITYVHPDELRKWQRAAYQKDRTRRAIRERLLAGESAEDIAQDFELPIEFVQFLGLWQLDGDRPQPPSSLVPYREQEEP